ncbi:alpha-L-fucosidase [Sphingobacterium deserti]|uniref:alpha-L-fucosidase n=1 Tax=Sphingobacterium deserti TaxID=1229276 RepID=A0A0B8T653_9SPHI|nr:alpha-L-fucosidase [Sphingobacterium deserti]KGE13344.1 alpha-L-fucosidase [Sphingobacterium deserti]
MKLKISIKIACFLSAFMVCINVYGQQNTPNKERLELRHGSHREGKRNDAEMQRWRDYGLGQFIHWGVYAIPGGAWDGISYNGAAEWIRSWSEKSGAPKDWRATYDKLYKQFNPQHFDAKIWAKQAKKMGARYMIFTTKHHDGFCLWPSKYTKYTIVNSPYKKDIVKEVVEAYAAEGIDVYLYFSIIFWNHPGYRSTVPKAPHDSLAYESFKEFTRNQLVELLQNYPQTKGLWFDGSWDAAWVNQAAWTDKLETELRQLKPGLIIGSRFRADEYGKRHFDSNGIMMGDYEQGWERKLPTTIDDTHGNDWDCVMTIPPNQWGYNADWKSSYIKTPYDLIAMLMQANSLNGNFVINFGPDGQGAIRPEESAIAAKVGEWMQINSEAVYGVTHANFPKPDYGVLTKKDTTLYVTVFNRPINNIVRLAIPKSSKEIPGKAYLLVNNVPLDLSAVNMGLDRDNNMYYDVALPVGFSAAEMPFVIVVQLEQSKESGSRYRDALTYLRRS